MGLQQAEKFAQLISNSTTYNKFIDLQEEQDGIVRKESIKRFILAFLMIGTGLTIENLANLFSEQDTGLGPIQQIEIKALLHELEADNWIKKARTKYSLNVQPFAKVPEKTGLLFKYLFREATPLIVFGCEFYDNSINEDFLRYVFGVQGNISIEEERWTEIIQILKLSPAALHWSLYPDVMIVSHRGKNLVNKLIDDNDQLYFLQRISDLLANDFMNPHLRKYFYATRKIVELDAERKLVLKDYHGVHLSLNYRERLQLAQTTDEYNNQVMIIRIFNNQPEPWDEPAYDSKRVEKLNDPKAF
ncbi:hypothetical protein [Flavobacterium sp.]|uniref:hypothetical protein n=2 Tax=Flavobacterium sp. TaxID=239 RepID=UPI0040335455